MDLPNAFEAKSLAGLSDQQHRAQRKTASLRETHRQKLKFFPDRFFHCPRPKYPLL